MNKENRNKPVDTETKLMIVKGKGMGRWVKRKKVSLFKNKIVCPLKYTLSETLCVHACVCCHSFIHAFIHSLSKNSF